MRQTAIVLLALAMAGGVLNPSHNGWPEPERRLPRTDVRDAKQTVVAVGESSPVSRSWHTFRCVFQQGGSCYGETAHYQERATGPSEQSSTVTHEFPPESFQEVQKVLLESKV